jgi:hypothetical protein
MIDLLNPSQSERAIEIIDLPIIQLLATVPSFSGWSCGYQGHPRSALDSSAIIIMLDHPI